ncbi:hypothetical protein Pint_19516 [Pistacia integerrima]|uniref:Uncharacterized protein n=1 Tax=Pistacia integerrima TaxID=434235 RepID=A0ACC0YY05_9ROSI|nr:hypothetical protein Pint_19516 [Pistacia integerrima]
MYTVKILRNILKIVTFFSLLLTIDTFFCCIFGQIASHYVERGANYIPGRICVLELVLHAVTGANVFHQELMGTESFVAGARLI